MTKISAMMSGSLSEPTNFTREAGLATDPVSTEPYHSQEFFERERELVFRRAWLNMGRVEEIAEPGDYIVKEIEVCDASIIIARAADGAIHAMHNVCSHRSNKLVLDKQGSSNRFMCRYHSWTYRNDGELIGVPDAQNFFNLDKKKCGLTKVACEIWDGWIFINLAPAPEVSLEAFLGDFGKGYMGIPYKAPTKAVKYVAYLHANWKVIADAFAETYHIPCIHPGTIGSTFSNKSNPYARPIGARMTGPHRSISTYGNRHYRPPEDAHGEKLAYGNSVTGDVVSAGKLEDMEEFLAHPGVNPTKSEDWSVDVNWIFPNLHLDVSQGGFWTHHFWPIRVDYTRWEAEYRMPEADNVWTRIQQEHFLARTADILVEDVGNTERTQIGLKSRAKAFMHLQDSEVAIRHSLHHINKWVRASTVTEALTE